MKVYVVTWENYEEHGVEGLFSTSEKADKWISEQYCPEGYHKEEWEIDSYNTQRYFNNERVKVKE